MGLHVVALLGLAMVIFAEELPPEPVVIESAPFHEQVLEELVEFDVEASEAPVASEDPEAVSAPALVDSTPAELAPLAVAELPSTAEPTAIDREELSGGGIDVGDLLTSVGGDAGSSEGEEDGERGAGPDRGMPAAATFFGRRGSGRTALFLCDNSASYEDGGFQSVLLELSRAVATMKPDQSFYVIFFSDAAYPLFHPESIETFVPATPENKRKLDAWLATVELCVGGEGIENAADRAVSLKPDIIYFLSDGDHGESAVERMATLPLKGTRVHTFGMQTDMRDRRTGLPDPGRVMKQQQRNHNLLRIAAAHGGAFTPVTISPQAAMAASVRRIKINRARGAIWGTRLPTSAP